MEVVALLLALAAVGVVAGLVGHDEGEGEDEL